MPNNDGQNDYWNIIGLNTEVNNKSLIFIYDRYGKLIKQLAPTSQGWNETYIGQVMPPYDYWYTL